MMPTLRRVFTIAVLSLLGGLALCQAGMSEWTTGDSEGSGVSRPLIRIKQALQEEMRAQPFDWQDTLLVNPEKRNYSIGEKIPSNVSQQVRGIRI